MRKVDANSMVSSVARDGRDRAHSAVPIQRRWTPPARIAPGANALPALVPRPRGAPPREPLVIDSTTDGHHLPPAAALVHGEFLPRQRQVKTGGRTKGTPNKVTRDIRAALRDLAEGNADRVQEWLDRVAETDPAEAIKLWLALLRYCVPTLSAAAIADVTPTNRVKDQLAELSEQELLAIIHGSQVPLAPTLPTSDPDDPTDEELLR